MDAGRQKHEIEAVSARNHGFEHGRAADFGTAAEDRLDRHRPLGDGRPGHRQVLLSEIALVARHQQRRIVGNGNIDHADGRGRRGLLRNHMRGRPQRQRCDACRTNCLQYPGHEMLLSIYLLPLLS